MYKDQQYQIDPRIAVSAGQNVLIARNDRASNMTVHNIETGRQVSIKGNGGIKHG